MDRLKQEKKVDEVFNVVYVGSIVPLKGQELDDFMGAFRRPANSRFG